MPTSDERRARIKTLEAQIAELEAEDKDALWFDEPMYNRAIEGLRGAIAYQLRMLGQDN